MKKAFILLMLTLFIFACKNEADTKKAAIKVVSQKKQMEHYFYDTIYNKRKNPKIYSDGDEYIINGNGPPIGITIEELKSRVRKGDKEAYRLLSTANLRYPDDQLFWSMYMANEYDYPQAYYDVYSCLNNSYLCHEYSLEGMGLESKELALEYLQKASKKGHEQAKDIIQKYYPFLLQNK